MLQNKDLKVHIVPLKVTLEGKSYRDGIDINANDFYKVLEGSSGLPVTSQPSAGAFAEMYRKVAKDDPDILSIPYVFRFERNGGFSPCRGRSGT